MLDKEIEDENASSSTELAVPGSLSSADLLRAAADPELTEDLAMALLKRPDLSADVLEQLAKNTHALKSRKLKIALASHPATPRFIAAGAPVLHFRSHEIGARTRRASRYKSRLR